MGPVESVALALVLVLPPCCSAEWHLVPDTGANLVLARPAGRDPNEGWPSSLTDISRPASSPLVRVCGAALLRSRGQVEQTEPRLLRTSLAQEGVLVHVHAKR